MAKYRIEISDNRCHPFPLWPSLQAISGQTRKRRDAAFLLFRKAIWEVMDGLSLRDRPIAHDLMRKAAEAEAFGAPHHGRYVYITGADFAFSLYRLE